MNNNQWLAFTLFLVCFAAITIRMHALEQQLDQQRAQLELRIVTREPAPEPTPPTTIYVDCPQVEIEPYDDEPFTPISVEEILEQAKERRRKLARTRAARPSAAAAPDSTPGSPASFRSAD